MKPNVSPVKRTGSSAGFHYVSLFQCCQRKFYFRYVKGWRPKFLPNPLVLGSAFHEAKAAWYQGKSQRTAKGTGYQVIEESKPEIEGPENEKEIIFRFNGLFDGWMERFGHYDRENFKVLAVEKELKVRIAGTDYVMTMRPDAVLQAKTGGKPIIFETKTSGFSHRITAEGVYYGDQATTYLWGVRKAMGIDVYAVQPDIAYWNKQSKDSNNRQFLRTDLVFRSDYQIAMFEASMAQLFGEITQKVNALTKGFDAAVLFARNTHYCLSFSHPCEYAEICGTDVSRCKRPSMFVPEQRGRKLGSLVPDSLATE
jgi:hypothetical protein